MFAEWLNRVGIILNFLAGFLLAPELIGIDRIKKAEKKMESTGAKLKKIVHTTLEKLPKRSLVMILFERNPFFPVLMTFISALLIIWIIKFSGFPLGNIVINTIVLIFSVITISLIVFYFVHTTYMSLVRKDRETQKKLLEAFFLTLFSPFVFIAHAFIYPSLILAMRFFENIIGFVVRKLEGDKKLLAILVFWGVIFFIIGNVLQLLATFM